MMSLRAMLTPIVMACCFLLAGCTDQRDDEVLVVYSAGPRHLAEALADRFAEDTGIRVELFTATSGQVMAKLEAERFNPRADVVILASSFAAEWLKREQLLLSYHAPWLNDTHQHWHDPDHTYFATAAAAIGIAVHRDYDIPDMQWHDILPVKHHAPKRRFNGTAIMPAPSRSGSSGDFVLTYILAHASQQQAWDEFRSARQDGLEIAGANNQAITNVLIGSHQAVFGAVDYLIYREIERGEPLVMRYPSAGVAIIPRPIAILHSSKRPQLAQRFVDHYMSESSQQRIAQAHMLPARIDTPLSELRSDDDLPAQFIVDLDDVMTHQRAILRRFQYEIERAVVTGRQP